MKKIHVNDQQAIVFGANPKTITPDDIAKVFEDDTILDEIIRSRNVEVGAINGDSPSVELAKFTDNTVGDIFKDLSNSFESIKKTTENLDPYWYRIKLIEEEDNQAVDSSYEELKTFRDELKEGLVGKGTKNDELDPQLYSFAKWYGDQDISGMKELAERLDEIREVEVDVKPPKPSRITSFEDISKSRKTKRTKKRGRR